MSRGIWKGEINFGLVSVPVTLHSAEKRNEIKLHLLDKRDLSPISYERVSKKSRKKVPWDQIIEGYEYEPGSYVVLTKAELKNIHYKATHTIDILEFVEEKSIDSTLFDRPYYLEPDKKGMRTYALLREALQRTGKIGVAKVVIHNQQHLAVLTPRGNVLVLELMRFPSELRKSKEFNLPDENIRKSGITEKEVKMAEQLIASMTEKWNPKKYSNEYRNSFLDYVSEKIRMGETATLNEEVETPVEAARESSADVIDLMSLLKKSIPRKKTTTKTTMPSRSKPTKAKIKRAS